jgi:ribose-phosphate pyrophosphokinase
MNRIVVFSGNAHTKLARDICKRLKMRLSPSVVSRFSNSCVGVQLHATGREADVFIIQPVVPPVQEHLMELLLILDAARVGGTNHGGDSP